MDLALSAIALISIFIFIIAYSVIAFASFRHHFVTGLISLIPVANILILPSVWYKTSKAFIISFIAIIIAAGAWFSGANQNLLNYAKGLDNPTTQNEITPLEDSAISSAPASSFVTQVASFKNLSQTPLPSKALYYLLFEQVNQQHWDHLKDSLIRITFEDETTLEGRVANILPDRLVIKYHQNHQTQTLETKTARIVNIEKLIRQPAI